MKYRSFLSIASLAAVGLLAFGLPSAEAFIAYTPPTLGNLCRQASHIYVLRVERVEKEGPQKGSIVFKYMEQLKGQGKATPDGPLAKHVFAWDTNLTKPTGPREAKVILDWAAEGKMAVLFAQSSDPPKRKQGEPVEASDLLLCGVAHIYIDGYWYWANCDDVNRKVWVAVNGEPIMLTRYCGPANKLGPAVATILRGEQIVVPAMVGDDQQDLEARRAKIQDLPASLKILNYDEQGKPLDESGYPGGKVIPVAGRLPSGKPVGEPGAKISEPVTNNPDDKVKKPLVKPESGEKPNQKKEK